MSSDRDDVCSERIVNNFISYCSFVDVRVLASRTAPFVKLEAVVITMPLALPPETRRRSSGGLPAHLPSRT
jgi:hypothetical protein